MLSAGIKTQSSISTEKSGIFQCYVETFINERIPEIVSCNISSLSSSVVKAMMDPIHPVVNTEILKWQQHDYVTLNDFEQGLNSKINETLSLTYHRDVLSVGISDFVDSSILETVLNEFVLICEKNGVIGKQDFSNLISTAKKYWASFEKDEHPQCLLEKLDIKDCIQHFSKSISDELSKKVFFVLANMPGMGLLLAAIAACSLVDVTLHGIDACKARWIDNAKKHDLYQWIRKQISVDQVDNIISEQENNIREKIDSLICNDHVSQQICTSLRNFINGMQAVLLANQRLKY